MFPTPPPSHFKWNHPNHANRKSSIKERKYQEGRLPLKATVTAKQWIREVLGVIGMEGNCTSHCILPYGSTFDHFLIVTSQ